MSRLSSPVNSMVLAQKLFEPGQTKERLSTKPHQEDIVDTNLLNIRSVEKKSYTRGSLLESKNEISKDKSTIWQGGIPVTKLSKILEADLTSKEKVSEQYWNNYSEEISKRLSYHPQIGLAEWEELNCSNGCSNISEEYSQFSTKHLRVLMKNSPKNYLKLLQCLPQDTMEDVTTKITRKVRIYPNKTQKELFDKCFGAHNYFYNKAVENLKKDSKLKLKDFRKLFIPRDKQIKKCLPDTTDSWMMEIPLDTREEASRKALSAQKTGFTQQKRGIVKKFKLKYRSRKYSSRVFYVAKKALINGALFSRRLKKDKYLCSKKDKKTILKSEGIFSIRKELDGRYYICVVVNSKEKPLSPKNNICALDPGVRTFQTMYSEHGVAEFGYNASKKIYNWYRRIDRLKSVIANSTLTSFKRCKLKKRCALLRTKIKNFVSDLHWKTCDLLTKEHQVILLPVFNTKNMSSRSKRKISKTTTRLMLGLRHYDFQQKLLYKAHQRGRTVILCKEHYTTKCCGSCGSLNQTIGGSKVFKCSNCNLLADRDIHAARNILIRALSIYLDGLSGPM